MAYCVCVWLHGMRGKAEAALLIILVVLVGANKLRVVHLRPSLNRGDAQTRTRAPRVRRTSPSLA